MQKAGLIFILLLGWCCYNKGYAQDAHFSQFLYSPHNLNPGMTGNFEGRYRLAFNHKEQWRSFIKPFQTTSLSGDARNFLNIKNFGLGLNLLYDQVGTSKFRTFTFNIPLSYTLALSKDSMHSITIGVQPGYENQGIDPSDLTFGSQWNGNRYNGDISSLEQLTSVSNHAVTFAAGLVYNLRISSILSGKAGVGIYNLTQQTVDFGTNQGIAVNRRFNYHIGAKAYLNPKWFLTPGVIYSQQGSFQELVFGSEVNYELDAAPYRYRAVFLGAWNRNKDAAIGNIGFYYNSWRVGFSYDVNYSSLKPASRNRGGWEVSVIYILRELLPKRSIYKICPNFL